MVWVGRELEDHTVSTPCCGQGDLPLSELDTWDLANKELNEVKAYFCLTCCGLCLQNRLTHSRCEEFVCVQSLAGWFFSRFQSCLCLSHQYDPERKDGQVRWGHHQSCSLHWGLLFPLGHPEHKFRFLEQSASDFIFFMFCQNTLLKTLSTVVSWSS